MRRVDPGRVHAVTLAIWLSGVVGLFLVWLFPRFFGAIALMALGVLAYGVLYAIVDARMVASDLAWMDPEGDEPPASPRPMRRPRRHRKAADVPPAGGSESPSALEGHAPAAGDPSPSGALTIPGAPVPLKSSST